MAGVLSIVVPCYNEQEVLDMCITELGNVLDALITKNKISSDSHILFVDDGSSDNTWKMIESYSAKNEKVKGIKLSRNKGHQLALWAGLCECRHSDITISIDADLQDDTSVIENMVDEYNSGIHIVYGVRNDRATDTYFKRTTAKFFYKFMSLLGVNQVENHADFRLLSRRALLALLNYEERNVYIRGLIPFLGFTSSKVFYSRKSRIAGESKYPLKKMLALALEGITSLSIAPLRMLTLLGFSISVLSAILIIFSFIKYIMGQTLHGWTSVILAVLFIGGSTNALHRCFGRIYWENIH